MILKLSLTLNVYQKSTLTSSWPCDSGAKFIHSKALKYKPKNIDVRVINRTHGDISTDGTLITGALATELDAEIAHPYPVAEITVIGNGISANPQIVARDGGKNQTAFIAFRYVNEQ